MFLPSLPKPANPTEKAKYERWLSEARDAYNDLVTGNRARVFVDQNGERIEYDRSSAADLARWITTIETALSPVPGRSRPRPIGFTF